MVRGTTADPVVPVPPRHRYNITMIRRGRWWVRALGYLMESQEHSRVVVTTDMASDGKWYVLTRDLRQGLRMYGHLSSDKCDETFEHEIVWAKIKAVDLVVYGPAVHMFAFESLAAAEMSDSIWVEWGNWVVDGIAEHFPVLVAR